MSPICPRCAGTKRVEMPHKGSDEFTEVTCPDCGGKGWVRAKKEKMSK